MKKPFKTLCIILSAILILVLVVAITINLFAGHILKAGIEAAATKTLNVGVSIGDIDLSIMSGKISFQNLSIDNLQGYQHDKLLELKKAKIEVEIKSLLGDTVNIREIDLEGVSVVLEQRGVSSNNLQDIISSIPPKDKQESEPSGKKLHIDNLEISNVTVKVKLLPVPGKADTVTLKLSPIKMTNLGSDDKLDAAALSSKILLAIADGVAKEGVGVLPKEMVNTMKLTLDKTIELSETASKEGEKIIDAGKGVIESGKEATEGLKGLLKPKKNDK